MIKVLTKLWKNTTTRYGIAILAFLLWIIFFDEHSLIQHYKNKNKLQQLTEQELYLKNKIISDKQKIKELQTSQKNLEKFAREEFLMKKPNEDVFLIEED